MSKPRTPTQRIYDNKRKNKVCIWSGCWCKAAPNKTMCPKHRKLNILKSRDYYLRKVKRPQPFTFIG